MFLHLSVILSTGGGECVSQHALGRGAVCLGDSVSAQVGCLPSGCTPPVPEADTSPEKATAADGTHPTGMHSCHYVDPAFKTYAYAQIHRTALYNSI